MTQDVTALPDAPKAQANEVLPLDFEGSRARFARDGFVIFKGLVDRAKLAHLRLRILEEFEAARASGQLFGGSRGGGLVSGHLNCFPGAESRFVYETLEQYGVIEFVRGLWQTPLGSPNVGCNLNLPGSTPQNYHIDGYFSTAFPIVNVAAVDTTLVNGAMGVLERTHQRDYKYWKLVVSRPSALRVPLAQGDVLVRTSVLWHRGMPNHSREPRPMLAYTWEEGGSKLEDPFSVSDGKIAFFPNRYATDFRGRLRERAFATAPRLGAAFRFVNSLLRE